MATSESNRRYRGLLMRAPSPHRGEGWGEGVRALIGEGWSPLTRRAPRADLSPSGRGGASGASLLHPVAQYEQASSNFAKFALVIGSNGIQIALSIVLPSKCSLSLA